MGTETGGGPVAAAGEQSAGTARRFGMPTLARRVPAWLAEPVSIAPLAWFRVLFGLLMVGAMVRFWAKGWIRELYVDPAFHFPYAGFAWVKPLGPFGTHALFALIAVSALGILLGWRYRLSAWAFFLSFTYAELMDKANYLNHYYFVSLVAFLLLWVPAHGAFSLDARRNPALRRLEVPRWQVGIFKLQVGFVYFFAGLAKLNADWLFQAQPLSLWLPAKSHLPVLGPFLEYRATAFLFSWAGAAFDLTLAFFLLWRRTFPFAYAAVAVFHLLTAWLFPMIGVFPWVMLVAASIFFPADFHERLLSLPAKSAGTALPFPPRPRPFPALLGLFFVVQALLPLRHHLYAGRLFWTEEGYRFSWRVMLMEKAGHATFYVSTPGAPGRTEVTNRDYLTPVQEKMMATQPDMILDFARHIAADYARRGLPDPEVKVHSYVTLNGRGSRLYVDSTVDLASIPPGSALVPWLVPYPYGDL